MDEFVSEPIQPLPGTFRAAAMATGIPGLPDGFAWRDATFHIVEQLECWKQSGSERGRADGERYLRRHYWRLRMSDDSTWTVYFLRNVAPGSSRRTRWFLETRRAP
jgi:hypothetical protein